MTPPHRHASRVSGIAGLVLAAGAGRRFGGPKALAEIDGERLVDRAVRALREGGSDPVYVVAGAAPLAVEGAVTVDNPDWALGMGSSLRAGLAALPGDVDAVVVVLVDQPGLTSAAVARLVDSARRTGAATVAVATYGGQQRHPVALGRAHWAEVSERAVGDVGARPFLAAHPDLVTSVECGDVGEPEDLDTAEDVQSFRGR